MKKRLLCLLLCLALLPVCAAAAEDASPSVRIWLKRLGLTDRADLWLDGVYTAETGTGAAMAFPAGSTAVAQVRGGDIYLFYQGMTLCAGRSLTFTRMDGSAGLRGIRFAESGGSYPGDLSLTVSGGQLVPLVRLSVEDYLMGVVPYEMSDSFPLEALKAQAVCARTYALANLQADRSYDMTDTTEHQVFRGISERNANAIRAVRETAGVVAMADGQLAVCWYAASNGGQTELPGNVWPGETASCYAVTDDPYDLENNESPVLKARLSRDGSGLPDAFIALAASALEKELAAAGMEAGQLRIDGIADVSAVTPLREGSRVMTELKLTLAYSGKRLIRSAAAAEEDEIRLFTADAAAEAAETPAPERTPQWSGWIPAAKSAEITLRMFPDVIDALGLSIGGLDNEIVTVTGTEDAFRIEARRYGHGVGMSQRGAQWMAKKYGKSFIEILSFYYPGTKLMKAPSGAAALQTVKPELAATPGPAATATPRPTLMPVTTDDLPAGAYLAQVEHIDDDSSLNLRAQPSTAAPIVMRLYRRQRLIVLEACEEEGWVHVRTDSAEGYVMAEFLEKVE